MGLHYGRADLGVARKQRQGQPCVSLRAALGCGHFSGTFTARTLDPGLSGSNKEALESRPLWGLVAGSAGQQSPLGLLFPAGSVPACGRVGPPARDPSSPAPPCCQWWCRGHMFEGSPNGGCPPFSLTAARDLQRFLCALNGHSMVTAALGRGCGSSSYSGHRDHGRPCPAVPLEQRTMSLRAVFGRRESFSSRKNPTVGGHGNSPLFGFLRTPTQKPLG